MNKAELIAVVAEKTAVSRKDVDKIVNGVLDTIDNADGVSLLNTCGKAARVGCCSLVERLPNGETHRTRLAARCGNCGLGTGHARAKQRCGNG